MEEQILAYLEAFGQPQSVAAICEHGLDGKQTPDAVSEALTAMLEQGKVQRVEAGVHANGNPTVEYAPLSFQLAS